MKNRLTVLMVSLILIILVILGIAFVVTNKIMDKKLHAIHSEAQPENDSITSRKKIIDTYKEGDSTVKVYLLDFWRPGEVKRSSCRLMTSTGKDGEVKSTSISCKN